MRNAQFFTVGDAWKPVFWFNEALIEHLIAPVNREGYGETKLIKSQQQSDPLFEGQATVRLKRIWENEIEY